MLLILLTLVLAMLVVPLTAQINNTATVEDYSAIVTGVNSVLAADLPSSAQVGQSVRDGKMTIGRSTLDDPLTCINKECDILEVAVAFCCAQAYVCMV